MFLAMFFAIHAKADATAPFRYCNSITDGQPCVYFYEGLDDSNYSSGDSRIWAQASYEITAIRKTDILSIDASLTRFKGQFTGSILFDFTLDVPNYEPQCMAYSEYDPSTNRREEIGQLRIKNENGSVQKTPVQCHFSRVYQENGYDFAPGIRRLVCYSNRSFDGLEKPARWSYNFDMLIASANQSTTNPCKNK